MKRHLTFPIALLLAALLTGESQGGLLLFQREISVNRSVNIFDTDHFDLDLNFGNSFLNPTNVVTLFDNLVVSPSDVGTTYDVEPNSDLAFIEVAGRITDALNHVITVSLTEDQIDGLSEQRGWFESFFFGQVGPTTPPDLAGFRIERISLQLSLFNILPIAPVGSPLALTASQPFDLVSTLQIYGVVPEPTASGLMLLGVMALAHSSACRRWQVFRRPRG